VNSSSLPLHALQALVSGSNVPGRDKLLTDLKHCRQPIELSAPLPARELLTTYVVRLQHWEETGLPPSSGLREFVLVLERAADSRVAVAQLDCGATRFVLLISAARDKLLAVVVLQGPSSNRPESDDIDSGEWRS